jgi:LPS-assembly protein
MTYIHHYTIFILLLVLSPAIAAGATSAGLADAGGLKISADSIGYDKGNGTYNATGNVKLDWDGMALSADRASLRKEDGTATAEGNILIRKGTNTLSGESLSIDLEKQQGEVSNGNLFIEKGNFHLSGARLLKTGEDDYKIERGVFTTCEGKVPSWKFSATNLSVTRDEYATGWNAVFYIKNIPVFYLPYILYPVKSERQSGLLIPRLGYSTKKGYFINLPYYLVISPSQDATFFLDVQTRRGAGAGSDYRYILKNGSQGDIKAYLIYDTMRDKFRSTFQAKHQQTFSPDMFLRADIDLTLDRDFYKDFGEATGDYNRQYLESSAFLTKQWNRYSLTTEMRFTQDLYADSNSATLQKLPILTFTGIRQQLLNTPLYFSLDSTMTNFYRDKGEQGQRLDFQPTITYYFSPGGVIEGSAWLGYRERIYNTYGGGASEGLSESGLPVTGVSLSSTLSRIYDVNWGALKKVKHVVIPEASYTYMPKRYQDNLPFYDFNDRLLAQNMVGFSVTNFLTGKYIGDDGQAVYRDLAFLRLSQGYEFSDSRRDVLALVDDHRSLTDLRIEARLTPVEWAAVNLDSRFNPYRMDFSTFNIGTDLIDSRGNSAGISYRYSRDQVSYLEAKLTIAALKPFLFHYQTRYSFDGNDFLESFYSLEFKQQCWGLAFSYRERLGDHSFLVNFTLSGVGAFGNLKSVGALSNTKTY